MPNNHEHEIQIRVERPGIVRKTLAGAALLAAGYIGVQHMDIDMPWSHIPEMPGFDMPQGEPEKAEASVRHDTFEVKREMDYIITDQVRIGVEVEGKAEGFRLPLVGSLGGALGDGKVSKLYMADYLIGNNRSENKRLITEKHETITTTQPDGSQQTETKLVKVTLKHPKLEVVHPRISNLDPANCANLRPGDSKEKIQEKINTYITKKNSGNKVDCDYGFKVTGAVAPASVADAKDMSLAAAELAAALEGSVGENNQKIINAERRIENEFFQTVVAAYPSGTVIEYEDSEQIPSIYETLKARFEALAPEIAGRFTKFEFIRGDKNRLIFNVSGAGGEKATVRMADDTSQVTDAQVDELNKLINDVIKRQ